MNNYFNTLKTKVEQIHNNTPLKYILLFGSIEEVPTLMKDGIDESNYSSNLNQIVDKAASDISYSIINNNYTIIVGRLSTGDNLYGTTNELNDTEKQKNVQNQVDKIVEYEGIID